jgi:hypothetical protein
LAPSATFDPERAVAHYKPDESAAIVAAQKTAEAELFLGYARFPVAEVEPLEAGFRVMMRDLRFSVRDRSSDDLVLETRVDGSARILEQRIYFAGGRR